MKARRPILVVLSLLAAVAILAVVAHLPGVQRIAWRRVTEAVEESTGWRIEAETVKLRAMPARLEIAGLTIAGADGTVATLDHVHIGWRWRRLLNEPRRLEKVDLEGVTLYPDALPRAKTSGEAPSASLWNDLEIGTLQLRGGRIGDSVDAIDFLLDGVAVDGRLERASAVVELSARRLRLIRENRILDLGPLEIQGEAGADKLQIEGFELGGAGAHLSATGSLAMTPESTGRFEVRAGGNVAVLADWWDPNLATGLDPRGQLELAGTIGLDPANGLDVEIVHHGHPLAVAGYRIETAAFSLHGGTPEIRLGDSEWGRAAMKVIAPDTVAISAVLDEAPVDRLLVFVAPRAAEVIRGPSRMSGEIEGVVSYPVSPETLEGRVDLVLGWADGEAALSARGAGKGWEVSKLEIRAAGATLTAAGRVDGGEGVRADVGLAADQPRTLVDALTPWFPEVDEFWVDGGPITAELHVSGTLDDPLGTAQVRWSAPVVGGRRLERCSIEASGGLDDVTWEIEATATRGSSIAASGWLRPGERSAGGVWRLEASNLAEVANAYAAAGDRKVTGRLGAAGGFAVSTDGYRIDGSVSGNDVGVDALSAPRVAASFAVDDGVLSVVDLDVEAFDGSIRGAFTVPLTGASTPFDADFECRGLDLGGFMTTAPASLSGRISGRARLGGSVTRPEGSVSLAWQSDGQNQLLERFVLDASLAGGVLRVAAGEAQTSAGLIVANAVLPLGDLQRPEWLWPDAPGGVLRASVEGRGLRSGPVMDALGRMDVPAEASADLKIAGSWNPLEPDRPRVLAEVDGLRLRHPSGELAAEGPVIITLDGQRLEVAPVVLSGENGRIEAQAVYDPIADEVVGRLRAVLSPGLARMLPLPFELDGEVGVTADLRAPASTSASLASARGTITIDHRGGTIIVRDPPLEVRDLQVVAKLDEDGITIVDGSAEVNRGQVELGGGWNPASGQGVVMEFEDVTMLTAGVLTKWDGDISLEPSSDGIAHVAGDLRLVAGLWDENLSLTSAVFGPARIAPASDDPLHDISLDIVVRGRSGIRVDNNLGRFDASWDRLLIGGTAAIPTVEGEVRIAPGGTLSLAGQEIKVRRGSLRFTGDSTVDPMVEIVPDSDTALAVEGAEAADATLLATSGLAHGISSVLGFENDTLQPAEIAVQTEKDPSVNFMIGQRLTTNLALFLTTNLTNVQDRITMLQLWNLRGFRGLSLQAYQQTADDNFGLNLFQRFQWGGTRSAIDRPEIRRLRLEGDWPVSKHAIRKSTRLRRGQDFDPFLLFVAAVRMERALAEQGYQEARVTGTREGSETSPILVFRCDPGPLQVVDFAGDLLPTQTRKEVTALYRAPPLEQAALANMRAVVMQNLAVTDFPEAEVMVVRRKERIMVEVARGEKLLFGGLALEGVPEASAPAIRLLLDSSSSLVMAANEPERIAAAVTRVMANHGYLEARVPDVEVVPAGAETADVRITVDPGPREVIDEVEVDGDDPLGLAADDTFALRAGDPLDRSAVDLVARELRAAYHSAGYREAQVHTTIDHQERDRWVVKLEIDPGDRRTVRKVQFIGARGVSERVLRKGLTVSEGEVLTDSSLDLSASRIANFAPVERIEVQTIDNGHSQADVEINVVQKPRWTVEVGGGWSTERGTLGKFGLRDDNLFARGVGLNLRGSVDATEKRVFFIGSLPPTPASRWSLISTIGYSVGDAPDEPDLLEQEEDLVSFEAKYAVKRRASASVYYRWTNTHTYEKDPDDFFPIDSRIKVGVLGVRTVIDRFDSLFDPRSGYGLTSDFGWSSSAVGSDLEYLSWLTNFTLALEPFAGYTWIQTVRVGVAEALKGTNLDREARFFAGGQSSIRGFDLNSVGPVIYGVEGGLVPAGGGGLFILNEELRVPVSGSLRAAVFADIGQVWPGWSEADLNFSVGVGVGVRLSTPIGPLWADVAWPVANVGISSKKAKFYLGFGRPF